MAFTKKRNPTKPSKPASYARKSKKHEEVEEQEVQEEQVEESDYEDAPEDAETEEQEQEQEQEPERSRAGGYQSNNYVRDSHRPSAGSRNSYGASRRHSQGPQGDGGKGVRVTGLFAGKREGLWTGRLRREDIEKLMGLFEDALNTNQLVAMFLWENQDGPQFSLTANIAQEFKENGGGGRRFNRGYRGSIGRQ